MVGGRKRKRNSGTENVKMKGEDQEIVEYIGDMAKAVSSLVQGMSYPQTAFTGSEDLESTIRATVKRKVETELA